jgi:hypothetical protein
MAMAFAALSYRPIRRVCVFLAFSILAGSVQAQQAAVGVAQGAGQAHRIGWHWTPGKTYQLQTESELTMPLAPLGRSGEQVLQVIQNTEIAVRAGKQPDTKELAVRFVTLRARLAVDGKTFLYDSEEPSESDPALRQMLADSSGNGFTLIYSNDDRFVGIGTVEQPAARPDQEPSLMAVADARQVAELYRRSLEMVLPRPEVAPGDKWTSVEHMAFPQAGNMDVKMNCHYVGAVERERRPHAKVTFEGKISQAAEAAGATAGSRPVALGGDSTLSGQLFFDLERRVISLSVFLGSIVIVHEGKSLPVRQSVTTRLEGIVDSQS